MPRSLFSSSISLVLAAFTVAACGGAPPAESATSAKGGDFQTELERYLPLEDGTVYSYDTASDGGHDKGVLIVQISGFCETNGK